MAKNKEFNSVDQEEVLDIELLKKRLDLLDQRLDHIDSVVSAVVERIMKQPITFNITCSNCGRKIEIATVGTEKPNK